MGVSESGASLVYKESSTTARAVTLRNPVSNNKQNNKRKNKKETKPLMPQFPSLYNGNIISPR